MKHFDKNKLSVTSEVTPRIMQASVQTIDQPWL